MTTLASALPAVVVVVVVVENGVKGGVDHYVSDRGATGRGEHEREQQKSDSFPHGLILARGVSRYCQIDLSRTWAAASSCPCGCRSP